MAGSTSGLVGRRREAGALAEAVASLAGGASRFVALQGEPGIGKTRLLEELVREGERNGHLVLQGRGAELERELPFGVWVDALDDHVAWLGPDRLERMLGERVGELGRVLPAAPGGAAALPDERFRAHRAVGALLDGIAGPRPVVVALDDLQWADGASLELLVHLLRRPPRAPVLIALAFRAGRLPAAVSGALEAAARAGRLLELRLAPLSAGEVRGLLGDTIAPPLHDELLRASGGNPFYLLQLARARPGPAGATAEVAGVPPAVAAALGHEIAALSPAARRLAQGAAVAGDPAQLELACAAADLPEAAALTALDELVAADLLAATAVARRYRFRHPIVRRAIYESAGEGWRVGAHARAAAELEAHGGSLAARAHHVERCATAGDEAAIGLLVAAANEAATRAPAGAIRWLAAALRLMPDRPDDAQRRLALLVPLATALAATGELERALTTLHEALALIPPGELRVRVVAACAACENLLGRHRAAHDRLLQVLDELPAGASAAAGTLQVELAADALFETDFRAMTAHAEQASAAAAALGDPALAGVAGALLCYARYAAGDISAAGAARAAAAAALDGLTDSQLAARLEAPYYLGFAEYFCERYDDAIRHFRRGIAVSRAAGQGQFVAPMMVGLAHALEVRGRLSDALDEAEGAVEAGRLAGNRQLTAWALVAEGWTAAMTGDLKRAHGAAAEAVALIAGVDESVLTLATHVHAAVIFLEAGDPGRCRRQALVAGGPEFPGVEPGRRAWLQAALATAELQGGTRDAAEALVERAAHALPPGLPRTEAAVWHARAVLALDADDHLTAARLADRAGRLADSVGAVIEAGRSRVLAGGALAAAGDPAAAVATLTRAEAELRACGADRFGDEAARELRRLGHHAPGRQRRGPAGEGLAALSGREREVAELVALGRTNREIAEELFLSEKTVEGHLTRVFAKLGLPSRAAVAAVVASADQSGPPGVRRATFRADAESTTRAT